MATQHKTASGVPRPEATDEIDVVDIQGIADKVEDTIQSINLTNITSGFSFASGVTNFYAYKFGRVVFMRFDYQPVSTGFNMDVVTTTLYKPLLITVVNVATRDSTNDSARGITAHFGSDGLRVVAPEVPGYPMLFTCVYLT